MKNEQELCEKIELDLRKRVGRRGGPRNALLLVHSGKLGLHRKFAFGTSGPKNEPIGPDTPYHVASISKAFTSVLVARLHEKGLLNFDDSITRYLPRETLEGLFVYQGTDHSGQVRVRHLLNHSSGIADCIEGKPLRKRSILQLAVEEPQRLWTPDDVIAYTRDNQRAVAPPGRKFHYSDTGYRLLGKIVEKVGGRPFHESLHAEILDPLGMKNSWLMFCSHPASGVSPKIADSFHGGHEISAYRSMSIAWAGGGIASTTEDLLLFHKALAENRLVSKETLERMGSDRGKFSIGMEYGYGLLFINIARITLVYPKSLNLWGNFGSIAAFMFYNPDHDAYLIGSFNHSAYVVRQVFFLIGLMHRIGRIEKPARRDIGDGA